MINTISPHVHTAPRNPVPLPWDSTSPFIFCRYIFFPGKAAWAPSKNILYRLFLEIKQQTWWLVNLTNSLCCIQLHFILNNLFSCIGYFTYTSNCFSCNNCFPSILVFLPYWYGTIFSVCSHTFMLFWLRKISLSVETSQLSFHVLFWFICAFHLEISSFILVRLSPFYSYF